MRITGLDFSLTRSGLAVVEPGGVLVSATIEPPAKLGTGHRRLRYLYTGIREFTYGSDVLVMEGAAYGRNNSQHKMGGGWWVISHVLWLDNPDMVRVTIPPPNIKKYMTGNSQAGKDEMLIAVMKRIENCPVANNDEADALALAAMGADKLGWPLAVVPKEQRAQLSQWDGWVHPAEEK